MFDQYMKRDFENLQNNTCESGDCATVYTLVQKAINFDITKDIPSPSTKTCGTEAQKLQNYELNIYNGEMNKYYSGIDFNSQDGFLIYRCGYEKDTKNFICGIGQCADDAQISFINDDKNVKKIKDYIESQYDAQNTSGIQNLYNVSYNVLFDENSEMNINDVTKANILDSQSYGDGSIIVKGACSDCIKE